MRYFQCDYAEGCCPQILAALAETNLQQTVGYGEDEFCQEAAQLIREECGAPQAAVHFLVGGTQANLTVIDSILRSHQGVVSAEGGHIAVHESGAIEACGHKVLALPSPDGKISAAQIRDLCHAHYADESFEHTVQPGMVYLSFSTESGLLYSKAELEAIAAACKEFQLPLYIDGARLGYGLVSPKNDCTLQDIARLADVFYIGGTKQGALFGEAVVIVNPALQKDFRYIIKQKGGMLAKGRLLGIQFKTLFTDKLYFTLAKKTVEQALRIRDHIFQLRIHIVGQSFFVPFIRGCKITHHHETLTDLKIEIGVLRAFFNFLKKNIVIPARFCIKVFLGKKVAVMHDAQRNRIAG